MTDTSFSSPLDEYAKQECLLSKEPWYHYNLSREESEKRVRRNGEFLVRSSNKTLSDFVLTYKWNGKVVHILVKQRAQDRTANNSNSFLYSFGVFEFPSVAQLIQFHWTNQLPITVSSEAVIFRPVHYVDPKYEKGLPWKIESDPVPMHSKSSSLFTPRSRPGTRLGGIAGSVSDLHVRFASDDPNPQSKGASLLDLRGSTYMDPSVLDDIDYCSPEMLAGSLGSLYMRSSRNSLFDPCPLGQSSVLSSSQGRLNTFSENHGSVNGPVEVSDEDTTTGRKAVNLMRKAIRYVDMHESTEESHPKSNTTAPLPPPGPNSDLVYRHINYDLTRTLPPLLLRRTGPVERALDRKVWLELSRLLYKRVLSPLDYAAHLTLNVINLLLPCGVLEEPSQAVKLGILEAKNRRLRRDLYNRDRFLRLFIITSVLMADKETMRVAILEFWFELAQCLFTICRDRHSLSTVLRAIFSSKIPKTIWTAATTDSNAFKQSMKTALVQELSTYHQALGGQITPDRQISASDAAVTTAQLSVNSYDWRTQIPNLHPFLTIFPNDSCRSKKLSVTQNGLNDGTGKPVTAVPTEMMQSFVVKDMWIWELYSTTGDMNSLAVCLSRTETILALLLGPIKLERGAVLDKLYTKLRDVLAAVGKRIESGEQ